MLARRARGSGGDSPTAQQAALQNKEAKITSSYPKPTTPRRMNLKHIARLHLGLPNML